MEDKSTNQQPVREDKPNRAEIHPASTTQGGSNFGQGSSQLGQGAQKQGSESSDGSNYDDESGWDNEKLRDEKQ